MHTICVFDVCFLVFAYIQSPLRVDIDIENVLALNLRVDRPDLDFKYPGHFRFGGLFMHIN